MVSIHKAFSTQHSGKVWLNSFLAFFNLLLSHELNFAPFICVVLREVEGVLSLVQWRCNHFSFLFFISSLIFNRLLNCKLHIHLWLWISPILLFEEDWEYELRMVQNSVVNQRILLDWCYHLTDLSLFGISLIGSFTFFGNLFFFLHTFDFFH